MAPLSVLIIGAGVAGPTLASFLLLSDLPAAEKPRVTVLERSATRRVQGQNVDVRGAGVTVARKLGLETAIRSSVTGEEGAQWVDSNNIAWGAFAADKTGKIQTGTSDIEILRGRLADLCYRRSLTISKEVQAQGGHGIEYIFGEYVQSIEQDNEKVEVTLAKSGKRMTYDIVVGADGLQSGTRKLLWGDDEQNLNRLGMYAGFFSIPKGDKDTQWRRWFHASRRRGIMLRPSDTPDKTTVFMYAINFEDDRLRSAAADGRKGAEVQKALLAEYFQDAGWECPRIIKEMYATDDFYYDMVAQVKLDEWSKGRVVLLADAGYCASPISGMGTTLAFTGAHNLAGAILKNPTNLSAAFGEYEAEMRPTVAKAQMLPLGGRGLYWSNPETGWGVAMMHAIIGFICYSGLARVLMMLGIGPPAGDVPVKEWGFRQLPEWKDF
ncbi:hypothetical protein BAUCODRAFT_61395 [Baudoinia panamericana UAMH 10762]|uniref:FAD-binding domain-containing protein n=1 Tax=Baudoinia panamericana (strain UAMH 10762) TaxID=717646 RepID=M2NLN9_BAUPA|nr:uncharacterized protein BAUCODRAFT_61395 [Baudoinia panamericana UAMH 10762]EMD00410.1 hypothetical protein BAUCODRAFT_61395 [Baudoinia panamericana UAMH 10762]